MHHLNLPTQKELNMKILPLLSVAAVAASPIFAEDTRHAESHEHGVGQLDIAFEGKKISMELHAPGADIVGFEYAAKSDEDHGLIDAAIATLEHPLDLLILPTEAGCKLLSASAELEGEDTHHDDDHEDDDHKDDDHSDHSDHEEEADEEGHTEFHAEYLLECENPTAATEIKFTYFDAFPNAKELELQVVSEKGASAFEVERDDPSVDLSGLF
jgi:hypothetical protein